MRYVTGIFTMSLFICNLRKEKKLCFRKSNNVELHLTELCSTLIGLQVRIIFRTRDSTTKCITG